MIVCKKCGHQNEDDDAFCGACGTFLEWVGEKLVEEQPPPPPAPAPEPEPPEDKGIIDRLKEAVFEEKDEDPSGTEGVPAVRAPSPEPAVPVEAPPIDSPVEQQPVQTPISATEPSPGPTIEASATTTPAGDQGDSRTRAIAAKLPPAPIDVGVSKGATETPAADQQDTPHPVKPAPPKRRPVPKPPAPAPRPIQPGDLICGQCGAGNDAKRRFCRSCGASLEEAKPAVRLPWWKRIFRRRKRRHLAGERPWRAAGTGSKSARLTVMGLAGSGKRLLAILAVFGIGITLAGPWRTVITDPIGSAAGAVRRLIAPRFEIVHPVRAQGGTEIKGHLGGQAIDDVRQTYWAESARGPGVGEFLIIFFATPTDIDRIDFLIGALDKPEKFLEEPRPKEVRVTFTDATVLEATFKDVDTFQPFNVKARRVKSVRIDIRSVFPGTKGSSCSIAEVKFYVKR